MKFTKFKESEEVFRKLAFTNFAKNDFIFYPRSLGLLFFIALLCFVAVAFVSLDTVGGDASIYFSFSKNFWQLPYSFRAGGEVVHGATSPFWVIYLAFFGENFIALKIANIFLITATFLYLARLKAQYIFLPLVLLFSERFIYMNALIYEVALLFPLLCLFLILVIDKNNRYSLIIASIALGLMIGVRPEALLVFPLLAYRAYQKRTFLLPLACIFLPISLYTCYMAVMTGEILPASIIQRLVRHGVGSDGFFDWGPRLGKVIINFNDNIIYFSIAALAFFLGEKYDRIYTVLSVTIFIFLLLLVGSESARWRYFLIPDILCAFCLSFAFYKLTQTKPFNSSAVFFLTALLFLGTIFGKFIEESAKFYLREGEGASSTFDIRFARDLDVALESLGASEDAKILIYAIETQYGSSREYISLEGIISNFPHSFSSVEDLHENVAKNDYYVSGHACGMDKFANSFHAVICTIEEEKVEPGYVYKNEIFSLKLLHLNEETGYKMWNGIYEIKSKISSN